jgi:hypothetical protein
LTVVEKNSSAQMTQRKFVRTAEDAD